MSDWSSSLCSSDLKRSSIRVRPPSGPIVCSVLGPFGLRRSDPHDSLCCSSHLSPGRGAAGSFSSEGAMKYRSLNEIRKMGAAYGDGEPKMSRRERLERWAELLAQHPGSVGVLHETEYQQRSEERRVGKE